MINKKSIVTALIFSSSLAAPAMAENKHILYLKCTITHTSEGFEYQVGEEENYKFDLKNRTFFVFASIIGSLDRRNAKNEFGWLTLCKETWAPDAYKKTCKISKDEFSYTRERRPWKNNQPWRTDDSLKINRLNGKFVERINWESEYISGTCEVNPNPPTPYIKANKF